MPEPVWRAGPDGAGATRYHLLFRASRDPYSNRLPCPLPHPKSEACITIRARIKDETHYELIVGDNASGMSEEVKAKLFEAFFSTKGKRGTGLGLMVVARTAKMHHGNVRVESQLGVGTKFILTLPRSFPRATADAQRSR